MMGNQSHGYSLIKNNLVLFEEQRVVYIQIVMHLTLILLVGLFIDII